MAGVLGDRQPSGDRLNIHLAAASGEPLHDPHRAGEIAAAAPHRIAIAGGLLGHDKNVVSSGRDAVDLPQPRELIFQNLLVGHRAHRFDRFFYALATLLQNFEPFRRRKTWLPFLLLLQFRNRIGLLLEAL